MASAIEAAMSSSASSAGSISDHIQTARTSDSAWGAIESSSVSMESTTDDSSSDSSDSDDSDDCSNRDSSTSTPGVKGNPYRPLQHGKPVSTTRKLRILHKLHESSNSVPITTMFTDAPDRTMEQADGKVFSSGVPRQTLIS